MRWKNWDVEMLNNIPKIILLLGGKISIQTHVCLIPKPVTTIIYHIVTILTQEVHDCEKYSSHLPLQFQIFVSHLEKKGVQVINEIINATMHVSTRLGTAMYIQRITTDKQDESKGPHRRKWDIKVKVKVTYSSTQKEVRY